MKRFAQISITFIVLISLFIPNGLEFAGQQISRVGEARAADYAWIAYNDCWGDAVGNTTNIQPNDTPTSGTLKNYSTGLSTDITAAWAKSPSGLQGYSNGNYSNSGTDAHNTFYDMANMVGVNNYYNSSTTGWYYDLTLAGLDPTKTYTFAITANRDSSRDSGRQSQFTISDIDEATNASTSGVTVLSNESVAFSTGYNTVNGFVARWTGIQAGIDGDLVVRTNAYPFETAAYGYGPSVFMLAEEAGSTNTAPDAPTLGAPLDDATDVDIPANLQVTVTDLDADIMDVSFYGRPVAAETPAEDFLLIAIPDTQTITQSYPETLTAQFDWIADRYTSTTGDDLVFVTSLGDIVNTANSTTQWLAADAAFDLLDTAKVPYSVGPGNHDEAIYSSPTYYSTYFGSSRFTGKSWYQGDYTGGLDNYNNYSFFTAGGMDFILINLEYDAGTGALTWADGLLKTHSDKRGIVVQHNLLNVNNSWQYQATYDALSDNPNLFLMLCGHMHTASDGSAYRRETRAGMQDVHVLLTDYQDYGNNDYLRLLTFKPASNEIYAQVYSPNTPGGYRTSDTNFEQFTMAYDMEGSSVAPFELIGTATGVASGATASIYWAGLSTGVEYEWYAVASDGSLSTTSSTWSFTTGETGSPNLGVNPSSMTFLETEVGSYSELSYTISGSFLENPVVITPPDNFLVSTSSGSGFGSSLTLPLVSGAISETVYVRFAPQTAGELGGTITNISNPEANVVVSGTAISPTVNLCDYALLVATEDTYINGETFTTRNTNYGSSTELTADGSPDASALLKWDFSSIPANATIDGADLIVYETDTNGSDDYEIYQLLQDWVEGDSSAGSGADWFDYGTMADWQTAGAQGSNDRSTTVLGTLQGTSGAGDKTASLNPSGIDLLQGWYDGSINNYGIIIQDYAEGGGITFASSESAYPGPRLNVHYCVESTDPTIIVTPNALSFYALPSEVSESKTYIVSGYNLTEGITITPPTADFEISTNGVTFTNSPITLPQTGGFVSETPIYVRMKSLAIGTYSGSIGHTSGALTETVSLTGTVSYSYLGMVINGDIPITGSQQVILDMSFGGATPTTMRFANVNPNVACSTVTSWSDPEAYESTASWTLSGTADGTYKVCAQASLDGTNYTLAAEDTIILQTEYIYPNPDLTESCGLDIVLVIDLSSSIGTTELAAYKLALTGFVTALQNTPTNVSLVTFYRTAQVLDLDPVTEGVQDWVRLSPSVATTVNEIIDDLVTVSGTNWDDALRKARLQFDPGTDPSDSPNMIVFATDGDPSTWGEHDGDDSPTPNGQYDTNLTYAIPEAEEAKADGIHILGLGVAMGDSSLARLQAISGSELFVPANDNITTADYYESDTFDGLTAALANLVISLCGGSVTVNKVITISTTNQLDPANWIVTANDPVLADWQFTATVTSTDDTLDETSPSKTTTDAGNVNFKVNLGGDLEATLDIVEDTMKDYYTFVGAVCSIDGVSTPVVYEISTRTVTGIPVQNNELTNCTFVNFNPRDPTGVVLGSFVANSLPGGVMLTWETFSETNTLGFKLYRSATQDGERVPLNNGDMIPTLNPPGSTSGAVYSFIDPDVLPGETYFYWLQEYSLDPFMVNEEKAVSVTCWWNWLFLPLITK